jgi:hypothetical protein
MYNLCMQTDVWDSEINTRLIQWSVLSLFHLMCVYEIRSQSIIETQHVNSHIAFKAVGFQR